MEKRKRKKLEGVPWGFKIKPEYLKALRFLSVEKDKSLSELANSAIYSYLSKNKDTIPFKL